MSSPNASERKGPKIVIIGAGVGGLSFAIALKRQLGFENFTVFEKAHDVGGTWRDHIYPGCSSDVPAHFYSLSTDLKVDWSNSHPFQPELQDYLKQLTDKYSLSSHIVFECEVVGATWDSTKQLYHIQTEDVLTGKRSTTSAQILISALGVLEIPKYPDIKGISDFRGTIFHSARWVGTALDGKRVAVIGNGASATQFLPIISKISNIHVTQFSRTPNWIFPPIRTWFSRWQLRAFKHAPFYLRIYRLWLFLRTELNFLLIFYISRTRRVLTKTLSNYIIQHAPVKYHAHLIPDYALGCKRVIFDTDYLSALHRKNVELNCDGIDSIDVNGILTQKGELLNFDVIILATGYITDRYPLAVREAQGQTVQDYYDSQGGPLAYLGTCIPGFPNFYMLGGPNTVTGHTSVIFTEEVQVDYIVKLVQPIIEGKVASFEVTASATDAYNAKIQAMMSRLVWVHCNSWYRVGHTGKVTSVFPGSATLFWWWLRRPNWNHFRVVGAGGWRVDGGNMSGASTSLGVIVVSLASVLCYVKYCGLL